MIKILKLKKEDYSKITLLVDETEKIYFSTYSEEELKYIRICQESVKI